MKQTIRFLFTTCLLLNIFTATPIKAASPSSANPIPVVIRQKPKPHGSPYPRMPYNSQIKAIYYDENLFITFAYNAGISTTSLLRNGIEVTSITHETSAPIDIFIGNVPGNYTIEIATSSGGEYIGYFTIE